MEFDTEQLGALELQSDEDLRRWAQKGSRYAAEVLRRRGEPREFVPADLFAEEPE